MPRPTAQRRGDDRKHDAKSENNAQAETQLPNALLEISLTVRMPIQTTEERDALRDAAVTPRRAVRIETVITSYVRKRVGKDSNALRIGAQVCRPKWLAWKVAASAPGEER